MASQGACQRRNSVVLEKVEQFPQIIIVTGEGTGLYKGRRCFLALRAGWGVIAAKVGKACGFHAKRFAAPGAQQQILLIAQAGKAVLANRCQIGVNQRCLTDAASVWCENTRQIAGGAANEITRKGERAAWSPKNMRPARQDTAACGEGIELWVDRLVEDAPHSSGVRFDAEINQHKSALMCAV